MPNLKLMDATKVDHERRYVTDLSVEEWRRFVPLLMSDLVELGAWVKVVMDAQRGDVTAKQQLVLRVDDKWKTTGATRPEVQESIRVICGHRKDLTRLRQEECGRLGWSAAPEDDREFVCQWALMKATERALDPVTMRPRRFGGSEAGGSGFAVAVDPKTGKHLATGVYDAILLGLARLDLALRMILDSTSYADGLAALAKRYGRDLLIVLGPLHERHEALLFESWILLTYAQNQLDNDLIRFAEWWLGNFAVSLEAERDVGFRRLRAARMPKDALGRADAQESDSEFRSNTRRPSREEIEQRRQERRRQLDASRAKYGQPPRPAHLLGREPHLDDTGSRVRPVRVDSLDEGMASTDDDEHLDRHSEVADERAESPYQVAEWADIIAKIHEVLPGLHPRTAELCRRKLAGRETEKQDYAAEVDVKPSCISKHLRKDKPKFLDALREFGLSDPE